MWVKIAFAVFLANASAKTIGENADLNEANETRSVEDINDVPNDAEDVEALENKANDLLKQINEAINQSIDVLQKANDSEGVAGMEYLKQLKGHLKNMFDSNVQLNLTNSINRTILRRNDITLLDHHKKMKQTKTQEKYEEWLADMAEMREKIDLWMEERNQHKEKKKRERWDTNQQRFHEKCPKKGFEDRKKTGSLKYPCCRNCCKRSYMGCR